MASTLCILSCHSFAPEVAAAIAAEGWKDVVARGFPVRCGRPPTSWDEVAALLPENCSQVVLLGRACLNKLADPPAGFPPVRLERQGQCFHLVAGQRLVDEAIAQGGYLITPSWLADWRGQIEKLGFAPEQAGEFFHDFARELVLLDTGIDRETGTRATEIRDALKLPVRRIDVGLDHMRLLLSRLVLEWRLEEARRSNQEDRRRHASALADHVAAIDLLPRLASSQTEADAIAAIQELFQMLFAPAALHYLRRENGISIPWGSTPDDMQAALQNLPGEHAWTPDGQGFLLRIKHGDEELGLIAVDRLAFPAYRERYLNMALALTGVSGLAIENARNRRRLLEAEKMASLGILVAGVAHEINTPLGVSLTAASTQQEQARELAERFNEQRMTRSDLERYLAIAGQCADLIQGNLERIARLVEAFRQVAVEGKAPDAQPFNLRRCLDKAVASLGLLLPAGKVELVITCDPALEIKGVPGDWASIFTNLIDNSLKHGFRNRPRGRIDIAVMRVPGERLRLDYCDDGAGIAPEDLPRVFDPFFTTDLQLGTGLGMHLVYNLVTHRMGGVISCESELGQGACFHIEIALGSPNVPLEALHHDH